jgi:DNA-binding response OmpR family regulator
MARLQAVRRTSGWSSEEGHTRAGKMGKEAEAMTDSSDAKLQALVIDDEAHVREYVSSVLRAEGWEVAQSPSAEDAFQRFDEALWSVVFCDVLLGGANGYSVLRHFTEKMPETKVVLMTGHGSAAGALDATAFGAYDYLLKPFGPEELQSLSRALREQFAERPQRSSPTRQALHAQRLEFDHPADGRRLRFEAPLPADVGVVVDALRALAAPDDPPGG